MVGKCRKITDELIKACADNVRSGMSLQACAKAVGISYQTWWGWQKKGEAGQYPYSKWLLEIERAESELFRECLDAVRASMKTGNVQSAYFLLQTRFSDQGYGKKAQMDVNNKNLNINVDTSYEEVEQMRQNFLRRIEGYSLPDGSRREF